MVVLMCLVLCEHCGNIVQKEDLQEGTFICFWCWKSFKIVYPFIKKFRRT